MNPPCVDQPGFITTYNFRLDDRVAFLAGGIGNAQVYPQFIDVGLHYGNIFIIFIHLACERLDSQFHSFFLRICPVALVFLSNGLGDLLSLPWFPIIRPKLNDAGVPELANIYRFFEDFPGRNGIQRLAAIEAFPFFSQIALGNHLVQDLL